MWEGGGRQDGVEWGGKWDNCNSIINKYIKKIFITVVDQYVYIRFSFFKSMIHDVKTLRSFFLKVLLIYF